MNAQEERTFNTGPDSRSIWMMALIYFAAASLYCLLFLWRRFATDSWPHAFSLWYVRIGLRTFFYWLGLAACLGLVAKRLWAKPAMLLSAGSLALLAAVYLIKRFMADFWQTSPRLNLLEILEAVYHAYPYQFFSLFIMIFFLLYFRSWRNEA